MKKTIGLLCLVFILSVSCSDEGSENSKNVIGQTVNSGGIEMVKVEGGTFNMGSNDGSMYEKPMHSVTLSSFEIGKYEITQAQWSAVMGFNPSHYKGDNLPVECVSWDHVQIFISKLSEQTGIIYRLPTEAEWEFAASGGNLSKGYIYAGSNTIDEVSWYSSNGDKKTHPVGTMQANELGIYNMSGNVSEWCSDWYGDYSSSPINNPTGPISGRFRILRGGDWSGSANESCVIYRDAQGPTVGSSGIGFRLVRVQ